MIANDCDINLRPRDRLTNAANQLGGMIEGGELHTLSDATRATLAGLRDELLEIAGSMPAPSHPLAIVAGDDWAYAHHMVGRFRDCRSEADLDHAFSAGQFAIARLAHAQFASVLCAYIGRQALLRSDDGR